MGLKAFTTFPGGKGIDPGLNRRKISEGLGLGQGSICLAPKYEENVRFT